MLTGDRPTGPLHLGHYFGTLANRVRLQNAGVDVLLLVADYQVITDRDIVDGLPQAVLELLADYLAAGIDPSRTTIFVHSAVPALNQLLLPFLGLVSVAELQRNPTVKAEAAAASDRALSGLLTYPVHQAADILFCGANLVPVGRDQLPHLELTRTIARRFNQRYAGGEPLFPEPEALLSATPLLLGLDGQKMSKSHGNAIALRDDEDRTAALLRRVRTDGERAISYEPDRRPEVADLLRLAALRTDRAAEQVAADVSDQGASGLKALVTEAVNERLRPCAAGGSTGRLWLRSQPSFGGTSFAVPRNVPPFGSAATTATGLSIDRSIAGQRLIDVRWREGQVVREARGTTRLEGRGRCRGLAQPLQVAALDPASHPGCCPG